MAREEEGREHEAYGETFEDFDDTFLWSRYVPPSPTYALL
jgi:hypothetical protein